MLFGEHRDDAIGFSEFLRAKHNGLIPVQTHTGKGSV
jgi:hypothetical protein